MLNTSIGVVIYLSSLDITDVEPFIFIQGGCFSGRSAEEREREEGKEEVKGEGERRNKRGQSEEERKSGGEGAEERGKEKRTTKE